MKKRILLTLLTAIVAVISLSFKNNSSPDAYLGAYLKQLNDFHSTQMALVQCIEQSDLKSSVAIDKIRVQIDSARLKMKGADFWMRYLEPTTYKKVNGPLSVEWETEVFEKFEQPYKREGAGLTLAVLYLDEEHIEKDTLLALVRSSMNAMDVYAADSITKELTSFHHFFLCNRLFLLNLAAIYTTGFECPDTSHIIPELRSMLGDVNNIYESFNERFPATSLSTDYLSLYKKTITFVFTQSANYSEFDHFTFIKDYVNPLFILNQKMIKEYKVVSRSLVDYALNKTATSIFDKTLYNAQNPKGIFLRVTDEAALTEIDKIGKLLFYDPILSGNNMRSCASCHKPGAYFTDTVLRTSEQYDRKDFLPRNTPSLINAQYNHLIMMDGKHFSLQHQTKAVVTNPTEMGGMEKDIVAKVLGCKAYKKAFKSLLKYTPQETEVTFDHISSAITFYYAKFSRYYAPFDEAMEHNGYLDASAKQGFNLFMSKAQCATCHFVPQFNGVKPPFIGSEFEVLGVPDDTSFKKLDGDKGRYEVNPAYETMHAFRTGSVRNAAHTMPYMHNGVFKTLRQVIDFYNAGGGAGRGLDVANQTLSADSLGLSNEEKNKLIGFIESLNEKITFETAPDKLPGSKNKAWNKRKTGGVY